MDIDTYLFLSFFLFFQIVFKIFCILSNRKKMCVFFLIYRTKLRNETDSVFQCVCQDLK